MISRSMSLDAVIEHYLDRRRAASMLSSREAISAFRTLMPEAGGTDRELGDLFAAAAIRRGRNIAFDLEEAGQA